MKVPTVNESAFAVAVNEPLLAIVTVGQREGVDAVPLHGGAGDREPGHRTIRLDRRGRG